MAYIPQETLPETLWRDGRYYVSRTLHEVYMRVLSQRNLLAQAKEKRFTKKVHGGEGEEETNEHYTGRFCASVVRVQNVVLDTQAKFGNIPKDVLQTFSSHSVSILDLPSGTGAGGLSIVSIVHELRVAGLVPMLPLDVNILAGDISHSALKLYEQQATELVPKLATSGITLHLNTEKWDALDLESTHHLCTRWEKTALPTVEGFVLVTNFSGAGEKLFDQLKESFRHIAVRVSHRNATLLWIEPGAPGGIKFLAKVYRSIARFFGYSESDSDAIQSSEAKWWHMLHDCEHNVNSAVHQYMRSK